MKKYQLQPLWKNGKVLRITRSGLLGKKELVTFPGHEYQKAVDYLKQVASQDKNRPSRVSLLDAQGHLTKQWEYKKKPAAKSYETRPRQEM